MHSFDYTANTKIEVISMNNYANGPEIPLGFGMALAQNTEAMKHFSALTVHEQQEIIAHTHAIQSKGEMQAYVQSACTVMPGRCAGC